MAGATTSVTSQIIFGAEILENILTFTVKVEGLKRVSELRSVCKLWYICGFQAIKKADLPLSVVINGISGCDIMKTCFLAKRLPTSLNLINMFSMSEIIFNLIAEIMDNVVAIHLSWGILVNVQKIPYLIPSGWKLPHLKYLKKIVYEPWDSESVNQLDPVMSEILANVSSSSVLKKVVILRELNSKYGTKECTCIVKRQVLPIVTDIVIRLTKIADFCKKLVQELREYHQLKKVSVDLSVVNSRYYYELSFTYSMFKSLFLEVIDSPGGELITTIDLDLDCDLVLPSHQEFGEGYKFLHLKEHPPIHTLKMTDRCLGVLNSEGEFYFESIEGIHHVVPLGMMFPKLRSIYIQTGFRQTIQSTLSFLSLEPVQFTELESFTLNVWNKYYKQGSQAAGIKSLIQHLGSLKELQLGFILSAKDFSAIFPDICKYLPNLKKMKLAVKWDDTDLDLVEILTGLGRTEEIIPDEGNYYVTSLKDLEVLEIRVIQYPIGRITDDQLFLSNLDRLKTIKLTFL